MSHYGFQRKIVHGKNCSRWPNDFRTPVAEGLKIDFRMTHQDIVNAIGATRGSFTRILSKLRETGWLIKADGFLIITGP